MEGTEAAKFVSKAKKESAKPQPKKNAKWKFEHEQFMNAIRAARGDSSAPSSGPSGGKGGAKGSAPAPAPSLIDPSLVQCPHCERRFNETAAERHIPFCKNTKGKPTRLAKGGGITASNARSKSENTPPPQQLQPQKTAPMKAPAPVSKAAGGLRSNNTRR